MADRLRAMFCDHLSLMRGKYLPASKMKSDGTRLARPTFSVHWDKDLILDAPHTKCREGIPDMEFRWEGSEIRAGWEPDTKVVTGDLYDSDGVPLPLCPRGALKRAVADWHRHGLTPKLGIELEAFAFEIGEDGSLSPLHAPGGIVYGTGPFADPAGFTDAIWNRAEEAGFRLELITAEYDTPQYEFTLAYDEAVKAVDEMVLFRQMAREVALEHGILLTFLPKPILDKGGSGLHFNLSFADGSGKNALMTGPKGGPAHMNDLARGCVAGWMRHHKGLAGLLAPTVGSYLRLQPASMSGYWCNWGGDHRGVTVRVSEEGGPKTRLEHRMADASCNPYTALAALLQAARLGVEKRYPLPEAEAGDCFDRTDAGHGTAGSLAEAMDDLEADTALGDALGRAITDHHIFMKRIEVDKTAGLEGAALRDYYIWYIEGAVMQATWKLPNGQAITLDVAEGMNLMQAAVARGIPGVVGECGGSLSCATCHVVVAPDWADRAGAPGAFEEDMLDITEAERQPTSRLSCQIRMSAELDGIVVSVPAP